jgi:drug/metabolite transporter (DMT)-like permease
LLAALSALLYGGADFCGGLASRKAETAPVLLLSQLCGLAVALAASLLIPARAPTGADALWGAAAGLCGVLGLAALYRALAGTIVAVASPTAAVVGAVIPVLVGLAAGERPGTLAWLGIALAGPAIVLLTLGPPAAGGRGGVRRALALGTAAGLGFGLFFVALSRAPRDGGLWPLAAARAASVSAMAVAVALARRPLRAALSAAPVIALAGVLDMGANIAFLLASRAGMLTVAAVVASLYPAPTVVLARLFWRERLPLPRIAGIGLAIAGVALISVR